MKNKIILFILFVVLLIVGLSFDDALDQSVLNSIEKFETNRKSKSDAYLYLNGISSLKAENIFKYGKYKLLAKKNTNNYSVSSHIDFQTIESQTPTKDSTFYCKIWIDGCLEKVTSSRTAWEVELEFRKKILERYKRYLEFSDYSTLSYPDESEVYPNYKYLVYGNRLFSFENLLLADKQHGAISIDNLAKNIKRLKKQMINADNLVFKMTLVAMISESLDIISFIKLSYNPDIVISITPLSSKERSLEDVWTREFTFAYNLFTKADRNPELFRIGGQAYPWFVRLSYKPNMTINDHFPLYEELINISNLELHEFALKNPKIDRDAFGYPNIRNIFGHSLFEIGLETQEILIGYIARINDLNVKVALVNFIIGNDDLINPYYPKSNTIIEKDNKLCMEGPLSDERNFRCILH